MTLADAASSPAPIPDMLTMWAEPLLKYGIGVLFATFLLLKILPALEDMRRAIERLGRIIGLAVLTLENTDDSVGNLKRQIKTILEDGKRERQRRKSRSLIGGEGKSDDDETDERPPE